MMAYLTPEQHYSLFLDSLCQQTLGHAHIMLNMPAQTLELKSLFTLFFCEKLSLKGLCQDCFACHLNDLSEHPDYYCLEPEAEGKTIKIDAIRHLDEAIYHSALRGYNKLIFIKGIEHLPKASLNALLKKLEEPPLNTYFILSAMSGHHLEPTLLSRCQLWHLKGPPCSVANSTRYAKDLEQIRQNPYSVLELAHEWEKTALIDVLEGLMQACHQGLLAGGAFEIKQDWIAYYRFLIAQHEQLKQCPQLNKTLCAEALALYWKALIHPF